MNTTQDLAATKRHGHRPGGWAHAADALTADDLTDGDLPVGDPMGVR
jgi:hypothetical protein